MTLNSSRDRRTCDQRAIVIKRKLLVCDGDDDLEWTLWSVLRRTFFANSDFACLCCCLYLNGACSPDRDL